jgi:hypothetical protein
MKKLVFMFVAVAAISFASCGGNQQAAAPQDTEVEEVVDSVEADSVEADTLAADSVTAEAAVAE